MTKQLAKSLLFTLMFVNCGTVTADQSVLAIWKCDLNEGVAWKDVQRVNRKWLSFMKQEVSDDIRTSVVTPIVGDATKFMYIDTFPSLQAWSLMEKALRTKTGQSIEAQFDEVAECVSNTLHYESKTK